MFAFGKHLKPENTGKVVVGLERSFGFEQTVGPVCCVLALLGIKLIPEVLLCFAGRMAYSFQNDDPDYTLEDYYSDFDDWSSSEGSTPRSHRGDPFDSDLEDDFDMLKQEKENIYKDYSGIGLASRERREEYRENRVKKYKNFESLSFSREGLDKECMQVEKGNKFYDFQFNTRLVKLTILHFQLRSLVCATSKHNVYLVQNYSFMHWSALRNKSKEVLSVGGRADPSLAVSRMQVTTMSVKDNLLVAGGFRGELICKYLNQAGVAFSTKMTADDAVTNAVDIFSSSSGPKRVKAGNNDAHVRVFDTAKFACINSFQFPWPVNNTSVSEDGKQMAVRGDSADGLMVDAQSGKFISNLRGHRDYSSRLPGTPTAKC
ncbi:hypothetical protein AKJ16_DCAP14143 [Drosera capensis]